MADTVNVQINFSRPAQSGLPQFSDAVYVPFDQYQQLTQLQIADMEDARYNAWVSLIQNPPAPAPVARTTIFTKFGFRNLFTVDELISIDNYDLNAALPAEAKAAIRSFLFSFQVADEIDLNDPSTRAGVTFLEQCGLVSTGRASQILNG